MKCSSFPRPWTGFFFVSASGTLFHFLYDWSGQCTLVGLFSAVNESIWEHMKLLFFPMFLFALFQSRFINENSCCFWCIKLFSISFGLILIPTLYYTYAGALGVQADWFNITIFYLVTGAVFSLESRFFSQGLICSIRTRFCFFALCLLGLLFFLFTFLPPRVPLFEDPVTGTYGLLQ